jgi:hypothetical protein
MTKLNMFTQNIFKVKFHVKAALIVFSYVYFCSPKEYLKTKWVKRQKSN